jgi:glutamate 5-kinase
VVIADGSLPDVITKLAEGMSIGTLFLPTTTKLESRKRRMISRLASRGKIIVDDGAAAALKQGKGSLLPAGVRDTEREFQRGDLVDITDLEGNHIGYGISNYSATDIQIISGTRSDEIVSLLGYQYGAEVVHRNNLVVL